MEPELVTSCPHAAATGVSTLNATDVAPALFDVLEEISEDLREKVEAEALRANDRYLYEFLEEYAFCPFARKGRLDGTSIRKVHYYDGKDPNALTDMMKQVVLDKERVVTQVIFPMLDVSPEDWHRFCHSLTALGHNRVDGRQVLTVAPLHPRLAYNMENANTLLTLFRRTPDPTIQWVRLDGLEQIYAERNGAKKFVPPDEVAQFLAHPPPNPDLYDRIAKTNRAMAMRMGIDKVDRLLQSFVQEAARNYARILLED